MLSPPLHRKKLMRGVGALANTTKRGSYIVVSHRNAASSTITFSWMLIRVMHSGNSSRYQRRPRPATSVNKRLTILSN